MTKQAFPLISIALCTYNGAKYLSAQLETLVNQTYPHLEIVAVDDNSNDETWSILKSFSDQYPFLRIYKNDRNLGFQKNFEKALQYCQGKLLAISDQDDLWDLNKIQILFDNIQNNVMMYHDSELIDKNGNPLHLTMSQKINFVRGSDPKTFLFFNCISGHSMLFRRELLAMALPFPNTGYYDHWLAFIASHLGSVDFVKQCLVQYRQHDQNCTDIIGTKSAQKGLSRSIKRMKGENEWLKICSDFQIRMGKKSEIAPIYAKAKGRMENYFSISFALEIWKNRSSMLAILKKNQWSKFCFVIRHFWGLKTKALFKLSARSL